ncbi:MAG: acetate/propionate family kinase [Agrococcus casei]|uniref:acetate/propionate family kinase n=1 Tax=Agrococcus casei TaxID=343512 RepID=UPI003F8E536A
MSTVFVVNAGSSSLKYQLVELASGESLASGLIERIGEVRAIATHEHPGADDVREELHIQDHAQAFGWVLRQFDAVGPDLDAVELLGVGHRVVQGGSRFDSATVIDGNVQRQIEELSPLAPLHNPANLVGIQAARAAFANLPHVAVFDTAFHLTLPPEAYTYALDRSVAAEHRVRKYGFHGTSHQFVSRRLAELIGKPLADANSIVLHLGNGASACAVRAGKSVETSMGMTPLAGLVMGTRTGDIDASVLLHLARNGGYSIDDLDTLLNKRSGLLGMAGSNDMRDVRASAGAGVEAARVAIETYTYRIRGVVGQYMAQLGRTDALAFTAGVGENSAETRAESLAGLESFGIVIDADRNAGTGPDGDAKERRISADESAIAVWVVPTNEELEIAQQVAAVVA